MKPYLESSEYIDWQTPAVKNKAAALASKKHTAFDVAKACFEFVRDEIKHSYDYQLNPITLKASEVLEHGTGYCYSKSHLLAALLRANDIPAALCYQRLTFSDDKPPFCLHSLNALHLPEFGWLRVDSRGNKEGVFADFTPPHEVLAFSTNTDGEIDFGGLYTEPLHAVIELLQNHNDYKAVADNLPDLTLLDTPPLSLNTKQQNLCSAENSPRI